MPGQRRLRSVNYGRRPRGAQRKGAAQSPRALLGHSGSSEQSGQQVADGSEDEADRSWDTLSPTPRERAVSTALSPRASAGSMLIANKGMARWGSGPTTRSYRLTSVRGHPLAAPMHGPSDNPPGQESSRSVLPSPPRRRAADTLLGPRVASIVDGGPQTPLHGRREPSGSLALSLSGGASLL
eukprot:TRINITY_DN2535_c0_g1_i1.p2 TRINITY_DN2535_c0_g1~~TRINITY_DN2535_c0_g1_i1.p2  ORF type:complete len:192 (+),score=35.43 TRINITY_DN2535_c0_g1_i1:29-577(+)